MKVFLSTGRFLEGFKDIIDSKVFFSGSCNLQASCLTRFNTVVKKVAVPLLQRVNHREAHTAGCPASLTAIGRQTVNVRCFVEQQKRRRHSAHSALHATVID